jgi:hypothetical protein
MSSGFYAMLQTILFLRHADLTGFVHLIMNSECFETYSIKTAIRGKNYLYTS